MKPPVLLSFENVLQTPRWWARRGLFRFETGEEKTYFTIMHRPGAIIVAEQEGRFLMVEQYRLNIERLTLEFPMGGIDPEEEPLAAAKRELREETGSSAKTWKSLGTISNANGSLQSWLHIFAVTDVSEQDEAQPELGEVGMRHFWASADEINAWIREGRIHDNKTLAAWSLYLANK